MVTLIKKDGVAAGVERTHPRKHGNAREGLLPGDESGREKKYKEQSEPWNNQGQYSEGGGESGRGNHADMAERYSSR